MYRRKFNTGLEDAAFEPGNQNTNNTYKLYTYIPKQTTSLFQFSLGILLPSLASTGLMTCARLSELSV